MVRNGKILSESTLQKAEKSRLSNVSSILQEMLVALSEKHYYHSFEEQSGYIVAFLCSEEVRTSFKELLWLKSFLKHK